MQDADALFIAIVAGSVEASEIIDYTFEGTVRSEVTNRLDALSMRIGEFTMLFGAHTMGRQLVVSRSLIEVCERPEAKAVLGAVECALTTTLSEASQQQLWSKCLPTRVASYLALCRHSDGMECLSSVLGGIVHADSRQLDDLQTTIEDAGLDIMFVTELTRALVSCLVH
tara:strand:+ start:3636 stop:4145 length:510 start_codon:yes stop_codon:yes gene_type:complete